MSEETVTRLMGLVDKAIAAQDKRLGHIAHDYRETLQEELTRLLTPLNQQDVAQQPVVEPTEAQIALLDPWMRPAAAKELLTKVFAARPPQPLAAAQAPADVPLLTDDEIKAAIRHLYQSEKALLMSIAISIDEFRAIEQAVRQKVGLK